MRRGEYKLARGLYDVIELLESAPVAGAEMFIGSQADPGSVVG
jgi:hypothetical protein